MPQTTIARLSETPSNSSKDLPVGAEPAPGLGRTIGIGASVVTIMTMLANVLNYASNLVFSRLLEPVGYGELVALLAVALVVAIPSGAAQTVIAERVAAYKEAGKRDSLLFLMRHGLAHVSAIAAVVTVVYVACIPLVIEALNLDDVGAAIALAPLIFLSLTHPVILGLVQGLGRFVALGSIMVSIALLRIIFGVALVVAGTGAAGAIGGQALGILVATLISAWLLRDYLLPGGTGAARSGLKRKPDVRMATASAAFVAFAVLGNLDVVLAAIFMSEVDVGMYAAISTVGKIVLFAPMAVPYVMVSHATRELRETGTGKRSLRISGLIVMAISAVVVVPAAIAPELVVKVMFGPDYAAAADGVRPILIAGAGLALLYLIVVYSVTINDRRWFNLLLIGVALQVGGISLFHSSPAEVATVQAVVIGVVVLLNEHLFHSIIWPWGGRRLSVRRRD